MTTYEIEYRNKYNVEWRVPAGLKPFDSRKDARQVIAGRSLSKAADVEYRLVRVTREAVE